MIQALTEYVEKRSTSVLSVIKPVVGMCLKHLHLGLRHMIFDQQPWIAIIQLYYGIKVPTSHIHTLDNDSLAFAVVVSPGSLVGGGRGDTKSSLHDIDKVRLLG